MKIIAYFDTLEGKRERREGISVGLSGANENGVMMAENVIVRPNTPLFIPDWLECRTAEVFLGARITRLGKFIEERFASRYWVKPIFGILAMPGFGPSNDNLSLILNTDNILMLSKDFDFREPLEIKSTDLSTLGNVLFEKSFEVLELEGEIDRAIARASYGRTLHTGDVVLAGRFPSLSIPLIPDTRLIVFKGEEILLNHKIK